MTFARFVVSLVLVFIEAILLYKLIAMHAEVSPTELITGICIVAALLVLSANVVDFKSFALGKKVSRWSCVTSQEKVSENQKALNRSYSSVDGPRRVSQPEKDCEWHFW